MFLFIRFTILCICFSFLTACATEKNIQLPDNFWQQKNQRIAIAKTKSDTPQLYQTGNEGLLDYAINSAMTSKLNKYIGTQDVSWYNQLQTRFANEFQVRKISTKIIELPIDKNIQDYRFLTAQVGDDKLLLLKLNAFGAKRNYYAFVPTSAPEAYCSITGELINTTSKQVIWRHKADITQAIDAPWDQPPTYPNVTKAMMLAAKSAQDELVDSFFSDR